MQKPGSRLSARAKPFVPSWASILKPTPKPQQSLPMPSGERVVNAIASHNSQNLFYRRPLKATVPPEHKDRQFGVKRLESARAYGATTARPSRSLPIPQASRVAPRRVAPGSKTSWASRVGKKAPVATPAPRNNPTPVAIPRTIGFEVTHGFNVGGESSINASQAGKTAVTTGIGAGFGGVDASPKESSPSLAEKKSPKDLKLTIDSSSVDGNLGDASSAEMLQLFKKAVQDAAKEYFQSADCAEFTRRLGEALATHGDEDAMKPEVSKVLVRYSFDQKQEARQMLVSLLEFLFD
eukprot:1316915-Amorphochlora_amoeboformis.AAC.1